MRSKTSCFNKTVFRKNLLRFAPVWGVYTLCLVVGILILYTLVWQSRVNLGNSSFRPRRKP